MCKEKVDQRQEQMNQLSRKDFESEIKRLNRLLLSYTGLKNVSHSTTTHEERCSRLTTPSPLSQMPRVGSLLHQEIHPTAMKAELELVKETVAELMKPATKIKKGL